MDNKEFAKVLLCEASSLLEGAQAEAYKKRKEDKLDKDAKEKMDRYDRRYADRYSVGSKMHAKDEDILNPTTERAKYLSKQFNDDIQRNSNAHVMTRKKLGTTVSDLSYDWHQTKDAANRHLRKQSKKTQNESIAILLTEAALLLNDED